MSWPRTARSFSNSKRSVRQVSCHRPMKHTRLYVAKRHPRCHLACTWTGLLIQIPTLVSESG
eukprot:4631321-Alexandrium_andersonii.AAC.1